MKKHVSLAALVVLLGLLVPPIRVMAAEAPPPLSVQLSSLKDELALHKVRVSIFEKLIRLEKWELRQLAKLKRILPIDAQGMKLRLDVMDEAVQGMRAEIRIAVWELKRRDIGRVLETLNGIRYGMRCLDQHVSGKLVPLDETATASPATDDGSISSRPVSLTAPSNSSTR